MLDSGTISRLTSSRKRLFVKPNVSSKPLEVRQGRRSGRHYAEARSKQHGPIRNQDGNIPESSRKPGAVGHLPNHRNEFAEAGLPPLTYPRPAGGLTVAEKAGTGELRFVS